MITLGGHGDLVRSANQIVRTTFLILWQQNVSVALGFVAAKTSDAIRNLDHDRRCLETFRARFQTNVGSQTRVSYVSNPSGYVNGRNELNHFVGCELNFDGLALIPAS